MEVYRTFAEEWMAMPVLVGPKSEGQKFPGAVYTLCIEALMQDGKALQAGTSHFLGQNFSKAFDVQFTTEEGKREYPWATSWGASTRLIGGLIMTHSDDNGLVVPPRLAPRTSLSARWAGTTRSGPPVSPPRRDWRPRSRRCPATTSTATSRSA